jgi:hypothetical protein
MGVRSSSALSHLEGAVRDIDEVELTFPPASRTYEIATG